VRTEIAERPESPALAALSYRMRLYPSRQAFPLMCLSASVTSPICLCTALKVYCAPFPLNFGGQTSAAEIYRPRLRQAGRCCAIFVYVALVRAGHHNGVRQGAWLEAILDVGNRRSPFVYHPAKGVIVGAHVGARAVPGSAQVIFKLVNADTALCELVGVGV